MSKARKINKAIEWIALAGAAYFVGSAIAGAVKRKNSTNGIGAAKRRIFKELSLAQKAGVDFTKKYDELTDDEIIALQKVSNDTGYTETYYKSLKKAYDAISGIGAAYNVLDADGNTVLTWIEDPEMQQPGTDIYDPERDRAYLEAMEIDSDRKWSEENKAREFEEREARLAEARKRLKKAGRSSQMALFGVGEIPTYSKRQIDSYVGTYKDLSFTFMRDDDGRILVGAGDETGGRSFYVGEGNFKYLYSYILRNVLPFAVWQGDHWIVRNDKNDTFGFGVGYAPEVEAELYEIWREQIEYGETEYDYDTWRKVVGDEYAEDVFKYMR